MHTCPAGQLGLSRHDWKKRFEAMLSCVLDCEPPIDLSIERFDVAHAHMRSRGHGVWAVKT